MAKPPYPRSIAKLSAYCALRAPGLAGSSAMALILLAAGPAFGQSPDILIPAPASIKRLQGSFTLPNGVCVSYTPELQNEASYLVERFARAARITAKPVDVPLDGGIRLAIDPKLGPEAYQLNVRPDGVKISGGSAAGVFYGIQTMLQMLPPAIFSDKPTRGLRWNLAAVDIQDAPQKPWRGVLLDSSRHYQDKEWIKHFIDLLAMHKINRLHWHPVDNEAWRVESAKYPKLARVHEAYPAIYPGEDPEDKSRPARYAYGNFHGGGIYSRADIAEIVNHARKRHVTLIPELPFPGNLMAALTAYPEFSATGKAPDTKTADCPDLILPDDKGMRFLKDILDEYLELFPDSPVIHIGSQKFSTAQWKQNPAVQELIRAKGLKNEEELQAWMIRELSAYLEAHGRKASSWNEPAAAPDPGKPATPATILTWRDSRDAIQAANAGNSAVLCLVSPFSLDSRQTSAPTDNWALRSGPHSLEGIYSANFRFPGLKPDAEQRIIGAQSQLWTELMPLPRHIEYQAFPRLAAFAEMLWLPREMRQSDNFQSRLWKHRHRLDTLNVNYHPINPIAIPAWNPKLLVDQPDFFEVEIPADSLPHDAGEAVAELFYLRGAERLDIVAAELRQGPRVLARDAHAGFTGHQHEDNTYRFQFANATPGLPLVLRVYHGNKPGATDSTGAVKFHYGKGLQNFDPLRFPLGSRPVAEWSTSSWNSQNQATLEIPATAIPGPGLYELGLRPAKGSDKTVRVTGGTLKLLEAKNGVLPPGTSAKFALVNIDEKLFQEVKSQKAKFTLQLERDPGNGEASGNLTILPAIPLKLLPAQNGDLVAAWNTAAIRPGRFVWLLSAAANPIPEKASLNFTWKSGSDGVSILGVQPGLMGGWLAPSNREGFAGATPKNTSYPIETTKSATDIRVEASADSTDSTGEISISPR